MGGWIISRPLEKMADILSTPAFMALTRYEPTIRKACALDCKTTVLSMFSLFCN
jgi:hypothetical protein